LCQVAIKELAGRFLLESQLVSNASAGIDNQSNGEGEVGFTAEVGDVLKAIVFVDFEVLFLEVRYEFAFAVRNGEVYGMTVHIDRNRVLRLSRCWCLGLGEGG